MPAPIGHIPLLVRAGSLVPLGPVQQYVNEQPNPALEIRVYPGADGKLSLYDDDGTSYRYEQGQRSVVNLTWDDHRRLLIIEPRQGAYSGMPAERTFIIHCIGDAAAGEKKVMYRGRKLTLRF